MNFGTDFKCVLSFLTRLFYPLWNNPDFFVVNTRLFFPGLSTYFPFRNLSCKNLLDLSSLLIQLFMNFCIFGFCNLSQIWTHTGWILNLSTQEILIGHQISIRPYVRLPNNFRESSFPTLAIT